MRDKNFKKQKTDYRSEEAVQIKVHNVRMRPGGYVKRVMGFKAGVNG